MVAVNSNSLEQNSRIQSALITVLVQLLLFLAIYFIVVWEQPKPPTPTYGLELNLGFSDLGSGDQSQVSVNTSEITSTEAPAPGEVMPIQQATAATSTPKTVSAKPSANQAVSTQPSPLKGETSANAVPVKGESKEVTANPKVIEQPKVDQRALFGAGGKSGSASTSNSATGLGNSDSKGDQGNPTGTGKAAAGGAGYSLDLAGWDFASRPTINDRVSTRNGRIVFTITVDGSGKVVQALPLEYNVSNAVLAYYRQVVNQLNFKKSGVAAADFSTGEITFVVKVD
ncbi:MAG: energy transducer TonB [Bacteroidetes bacterium]|nr:energy transducer TonB [Bacteroidota bacterium]MDA1269399.1 energy transducer TonB [Bacteroidota bacterium]